MLSFTGQESDGSFKEMRNPLYFAKNKEEIMENNENYQIPAVLAAFFDAETSSEKLKVIEEHMQEIDERTLGNIEASLDIAGSSGSIEKRLDFVTYSLRTKGRFETNRLR